METRPLGRSGLRVSPVGLGTVKIGRNTGVKYPQPFDLPSDAEVVALLETARELGVNLIDTAPAYGTSEARLGALLPGDRDEWVIGTKAGEEFVDGASRFDFSPAAIRASVERSRRRLRVDTLDFVLLHSDGADLRRLDEDRALEPLLELREAGVVREVGVSTKTVEGGLRALELGAGVVMVTLNPQHQDELPVIEAARRAGAGVLIKKALGSGHLAGASGADAALRFALGTPGVSSVIVGTLNPAHLRANVNTAERSSSAGDAD
ncbi:MAG: aldo/keto reductase [Phycisphaerales bacterium]